MGGIFVGNPTKPFVMNPKDILFHQGLSPYSKLVYEIILHFDRGNGCFPRRTKMSKMLGLSLYHIRKGLQELEDRGLITNQRRGQGKTNLIHIVHKEDEVVEEVDETISHSEMKSFDDSPIYSNKETIEGELDDIDSLLSSNEIECEEDETPQVEDETPHIEEETTLREIKHKVYSGSGCIERNLCEDGVVIDSNPTQITIGISSPVWKIHLETHYIPLLESVFGKEVKIVSVRME